jgi:copper(I)-binding protein
MRPLILAAALLAAAPAFAQAPAIQVDHPWARATAPNAKAGGAFMTLTDSGAPDRLVSAATPVAGMAEVHRTVEENGVMKMLPVDGIDLAPGQPVTLAPGGYHVMLMGLKQQLKQGDSFPLTLTFAKAAPMTVMVMVEAPGASGASHDMHAMPGMAMPGMAVPPKP